MEELVLKLLFTRYIKRAHCMGEHSDSLELLMTIVF